MFCIFLWSGGLRFDSYSGDPSLMVNSYLRLVWLGTNRILGMESMRLSLPGYLKGEKKRKKKKNLQTYFALQAFHQILPLLGLFYQLWWLFHPPLYHLWKLGGKHVIPEKFLFLRKDDQWKVTPPKSVGLCKKRDLGCFQHKEKTLWKWPHYLDNYITQSRILWFTWITCKDNCVLFSLRGLLHHASGKTQEGYNPDLSDKY